jgi:hypothetical protein
LAKQGDIKHARKIAKKFEKIENMLRGSLEKEPNKIGLLFLQV